VRSARASRFVLGLVVGAALLVLPAAASAASISGTVSATAGGGGIDAVEVCARPELYSFEAICSQTNGFGTYTLTGLPAGSYTVRFREPHNRNYVDQYFDGAAELGSADPVTVTAAEARFGVDAVLQYGGTIAGTVLAAAGGAPVGSFLVCAFATTPLGEVGRCWRTDSSGHYEINGLPPEDYTVEFLSEDEFNLLSEYFAGAGSANAATPVHIGVAGEGKVGIDATLEPGVEITGTLTEARSGRPLSDADVSLLKPGTAEGLGTVHTDQAGRYAFRGRPAGSYVVALVPFGSGNACYPPQFYSGSADFLGATPLSVAPPQVVAGVDAQVSNLCSDAPQPIKVELIPTPPTAAPPKCKKNQWKRWVKGKYRCVKKPKKHRKMHHRAKGHGPQAVATDR
jgi:Carboxypeptidase regulatory-like domain